MTTIEIANKFQKYTDVLEDITLQDWGILKNSVDRQFEKVIVTHDQTKKDLKLGLSETKFFREEIRKTNNDDQTD